MRKINLKKHLPTILSVLGVVGAGAVGISAARAQHKVEWDKLCTMDRNIHARKEKNDSSLPVKPTREQLLKIYCKHYWPTAIIFGLTTGCIVGSNKLNKKQYEQLLKAYTSLGAGFAAYRTAVIDRYGEEVDKELCEEATAVMLSDETIFVDLFDVPDEKMIFVEPISGKKFEAYERDVILAEYHLNRQFMLKSAVSVSEFLNFLGLEPTHKTDMYGWSMEYGYYWIDIHHEVIENPKAGMKMCEICYTFAPEIEFEDFYYTNDQPLYYHDILPEYSHAE